MFSSNRTAVRQLAEEVKAKYPDKTIWLYTGFTWEAVRNDPVMQYVDVLVDGEFQQETFDANLLWKGSANQRVIDVPESLKQENVVLFCGDYN